MGGATVRANVLAGWVEKASRFAVRPNDALVSAGIVDPAALHATDRKIPLTCFARLAEFVGDNASHPAASWLIGEEYDLAELGEVGVAATSARTLGGALHRLTDHFELLQDSSRLTMETTADTVTISYRILDPSIWPRYQDALFSLGIITRIVKMAVPDAMRSLELGFECARRATGLDVPPDQITFDAEANSIRLPIAMLDVTMPAAPKDYDIKALSDRLAKHRRDCSPRDRLAEIIFMRLSDGALDQDRLAGEIGMSSRTMRRRLANDQISFQRLLDDCRMRQAVFEFTTRPAVSIADIALRLGYAEHSTFTHAFTRWAGMPPQRYKSQLNARPH